MGAVNRALRLVELAYDLDGDGEAWLRKINDATRPSLDDGLGTAAYTYALGDDNSLELTRFVSAGLAPGVEHIARHWLAFSDVESLRQLHFSSGCVSTTSHASRGMATADGTPFAQTFHPLGIRDVLGCGGINQRSCVMLTAPRRRLSTPDPRFKASFSKVSAHLAAGLRLRESLANASPLDDLRTDDAVLDTSFRVNHASGATESRAVRDRLREAAILVDKVRARRQFTEAEALDAWRALVDGRWSLVDTFDSDGRRFIVARRNDDQPRDPRGLSQREAQVAALAAMGHSNKLIAYHLGLATSTVATHLRTALHKLGVTTRLELVRAFASSAAPLE